MIGFLRRWKWLFVAALVLGALYFATRLINLTLLPIFTDEAIYIRWSQIGAQDANWRFISLTDGKQPMFTWIAMVLLRLLPLWDPLFIGRLVSVVAGFGSLVGIGLLSFLLFKNKRITLLSCFFYLISPFSLLYDRMALYDSLVATFFLWNLSLAVLLVRTLRLDVALLLGMMLGAGMLNKTSGFLSLYLLPTTLLLADWEKKDRLRKLVRWMALVAVSVGISQALYSVLRLSPLLHMVTAKDALFIYPVNEWLAQPFRFVEGNLRGMFDWLWRYMSVPVVVLVAAIFLLRRITGEQLLLLFWWVLPFVALATFGKVLYPRFILFMAMPLLVLSAVGADWILHTLRRKLALVTLFALLVLPSIRADYYILFDPISAPIPEADLGQYMNEWPAGWGIKESVAYLKQEAAKGKISIYTEGTFGLLPYAIEIYLVNHPNVRIYGIWPLPQSPPPDLVSDAADHPTFFLMNQTPAAPRGWPLELVAEYQKGTNKSQKLRLYKVTSLLAFL